MQNPTETVWEKKGVTVTGTKTHVWA